MAGTIHLPDASGFRGHGTEPYKNIEYAPKEVIRKVTFWEKRKISQENITSERGTLLRTNRSIQVEGAFGLLKNDFGFRRFLTTGKKNVRVELFFLALGFNLKKRWMKQEKRRLETHYSEKKAA